MAEPWDLAAYQVGRGFPDPRWAQWNDRFRDDVRGFIDQQVRQFGDDLGTLVRAVRQKAPGAKVVILNLPNLSGAPYLARNSAVERGVMQRAEGETVRHDRRPSRMAVGQDVCRIE